MATDLLRGQLGGPRAELFDQLLAIVQSELVAWYKLFHGRMWSSEVAHGRAEDGDPLWTKGNAILNMLRVVDDLLQALELDVDSADERPVEEILARLACDTPSAAAVTTMTLSMEIRRDFANAFGGGDKGNEGEMFRGLDDFEQESRNVFGRLVPAIHITRSGEGMEPALEPQLLWQLSSSVQHLAYHLERDILQLE